MRIPYPVLTAAAVCLLIGCTTPSLNEFTDSDEVSIRKVLTTQQEAWNSGDIDTFMNGYHRSDSMQFVGKDRINFGWQTTLDNYKRKYPDTVAMGKLKFEVLRMNPVSADAAFLTGTYYLKRSIGDASGIFTLVFRKVNGEWVIVYDHTAG